MSSDDPFFVPADLYPPTREIMLRATDDMKARILEAKKIYLTYGERCCREAKVRACDTSVRLGKLDQCLALDQSAIDSDFVQRNRRIFAEARGAGLWLWKPFIIFLTLNSSLLSEGDYLVYCDAGARMKSPIHPLIAFMEALDDQLHGVLTFSVGLTQKDWCKRDTFIRQRCDSIACHNAPQVDGYLSVWRKGEHALRVAAAWLNETQDYQALSDVPNIHKQPDLPGFRAHRHDQAMLTNIMTREDWGRDTLNGPAQFMFFHDRFKEWQRNSFSSFYSSFVSF